MDTQDLTEAVEVDRIQIAVDKVTRDGSLTIDAQQWAQRFLSTDQGAAVLLKDMSVEGKLDYLTKWFGNALEAGAAFNDQNDGIAQAVSVILNAFVQDIDQEMIEWVNTVLLSAGLPTFQISDEIPSGTAKLIGPPDFQGDVKEFHEAMDQIVGEYPEINDSELRARLIMSEAAETANALTGKEVAYSIGVEAPRIKGECTEPNLVEVIDGVCDIIYVVAGTAVACGFDIAPYWNEVHRTNMAKKDGPVREDGKRMKPEGWVGPDIAGILEAHGQLGGDHGIDDSAVRHADGTITRPEGAFTSDDYGQLNDQWAKAWDNDSPKPTPNPADQINKD